jgi:hypothetical protein
LTSFRAASCILAKCWDIKSAQNLIRYCWIGFLPGVLDPVDAKLFSPMWNSRDISHWQGNILDCRYSRWLSMCIWGHSHSQFGWRPRRRPRKRCCCWNQACQIHKSYKATASRTMVGTCYMNKKLNKILLTSQCGNQSNKHTFSFPWNTPCQAVGQFFHSQCMQSIKPSMSGKPRSFQISINHLTSFSFGDQR